MLHLTTINDIEQTLNDHRLCLFYIKAPFRDNKIPLKTLLSTKNRQAFFEMIEI